MTGKGIFADYAWQYYKLGMNVMPVNGKLPMVDGFNELWHAHRQTEEELEWLVEEYGHAQGIAVVCGAHTTAVDVDVDDENLFRLLPRSPLIRTGSKGRVYLYRGSAQDKRAPRAIPLELFGRGYVVLPPSFHPDNPAGYRWVVADFMPVEELPAFTDSHWNTLTEYCHKVGHVRYGIKADGQYSATGGRNITLAAKMWAMLKDPAVRATKSKAQLVDEMIAYDQSKHPDKPWFEDPAERRSRSPRQFAEQFVERNMKKANKEAGIITVTNYEEPEELYFEPPSAPTPQLSPTSLIPKGGLMWAIHEVVTAINGYENHMQSLSAGLGLCSQLAGHKLVVGRAHPNLFILCTAASGVGKSAPQTAVKQALLASANGASLIGCDSYASAQALTAGLKENRRRIDIVDECKGLFMANANRESHLSGIDGELCKVFSASDNFLPAKAAINKDSKRPALHNPYLTLMMYSTPAAFYRYFSRMLAEEGFGGRTLFLADWTDPSKLERGLIGFGPQIASRLSTDMMDRVNYWLTKETQYVDGQGRVCAYTEGGGTPQCSPITLTDQAKAKLLELQREYMAKLTDCSLPGDADYELRASYMRAIEQHLKLIGCWVVSQGDEHAEVNVPVIEWANSVFEASLDSLRSLLQSATFATVTEENINRYKAWAKGKTAIDKKRFHEWIRRLFGDADARQMQQFLRLLVEEGYGHFEQEELVATNGKVRAKWVFAQPE